MPKSTHKMTKPKARVMFGLRDSANRICDISPESRRHGQPALPVLVIPFPSRQSAAKARQFWSMTEEQKIEHIAAESYHATYCAHVEDDWHDLRRLKDVGSKNVVEAFRQQAMAVLAAMGGAK